MRFIWMTLIVTIALTSNAWASAFPTFTTIIPAEVTGSAHFGTCISMFKSEGCAVVFPVKGKPSPFAPPVQVTYTLSPVCCASISNLGCKSVLLPTPSDHPSPHHGYINHSSTQLLEGEDDGLTQECKDMLASVQRDKFWFATDLCQYQGFWYDAIQLLGVLARQSYFQSLSTDLLLVTTPKSGTTWLKALAFCIVNRMCYSDNHHPLLTKNPHDLVPFLETDLFNENDPVSPRLISTHLSYTSLPDSIKTSRCKIVYLCRNPKDTFVSHWHFANKLRPNTMEPVSLQEGFKKFCMGVSLCGPFWDHVLGYWEQSLERPETILFLKYEEMMKDPVVQLTRLAEFLGYPFSPQEEKDGIVDEILKLCSFENLSNLEVNKTGKWSAGVACNVYFR